MVLLNRLHKKVRLCGISLILGLGVKDLQIVWKMILTQVLKLEIL